MTAGMTTPGHVGEDAEVVRAPKHPRAGRSSTGAWTTPLRLAPESVPADPPAGWRSDRAAFWARSLRGWDVAFYALWTLGVASYLLERPRMAAGTVAALAAFLALLLAYVLIGRRAALAGSTALTYTYVGVMIGCVGAVVTLAQTGTVMLFIAYSQIWYFAQSRRQGVALTVALTIVTFGIIGLQSDFDSVHDAAPLFVQGGIAIAFSVLLGLWVTQVTEQSEDRAELLARLEEAQADAAASHHAAGVLAERERMSREIHDTLAQGFTSVVMLSQTAAADLRRGRPDDAAAHLALIERTARENLAEARALIAATAPVGLVESTLTEALERLAVRFGEETGIRVRLVADDEALTGLVREREVILLRAAQEALSNVRRHARATKVDLVLGPAPDGGAVTLEVVDDGRGMAPAVVEGFGLRGMRERVTTGGGSLAVTSDIGLGTHVQVTMPVAADDAGAPPGDDDAPGDGDAEEVR